MRSGAFAGLAIHRVASLFVGVRSGRMKLAWKEPRVCSRGSLRQLGSERRFLRCDWLLVHGGAGRFRLRFAPVKLSHDVGAD